MATERTLWQGTGGSIILAGPSDVPSKAAPSRDSLTPPRLFRGTVGHIRWHHYVAAEVHGYTVVPSGDRWSLSAQLVASDAFKMSQRPLVFVALLVKPRDLGGGIYGTKTEWRWEIETVSITDDGRMTATLGPILDT
jgi:hypothetical protein